MGAPIAWWAAQKLVDYKNLNMDPLNPWILAGATAAFAASALLAVLEPAVRETDSTSYFEGSVQPRACNQ